FVGPHSTQVARFLEPPVGFDWQRRLVNQAHSSHQLRATLGDEVGTCAGEITLIDFEAGGAAGSRYISLLRYLNLISELRHFSQFLLGFQDPKLKCSVAGGGGMCDRQQGLHRVLRGADSVSKGRGGSRTLHSARFRERHES